MGGTETKPETETRRIVLLGKTGAGKSSVINTIFGENVFKVNHTFNSETNKCQAETRSVNGRRIMLIDTPGFFDTDRPEEELRTEIVKCITECAPGPHAFLIVLKVDRFTEHEKDVIKKINEYFSEAAFKNAAVVFTHGEQLEGMDIKRFVSKNKNMSDLVKKCGGRCHVIDNKYWNNDQRNKNRSNQLQVAKLLNTIDKMVMVNKEHYYTNEILQTVDEEIHQEEEKIRASLPENMSEQEIREQAKVSVFKKLLIRLAGTLTGALLGALLGVVVMVGAVATALNESSEPITLKQATAKTGKAAAGVIFSAMGEAAVVGPVGATVLCTVVGTCAVAGAVKGGLTGYHAADGAASPWEAVKRAAAAVKDEAQSYLDKANDVCVRVRQSDSQQSDESDERE